MTVCDSLVIYALNFIGVPYKWGGNNPLEGLDCSGFLCEVLRSHGYVKNDYTAQGLHDILLDIGAHSSITKGSCLFFGTSKFNTTHCALALNSKIMIEAGGGDQTCIDLNTAIKKNAFVRIRPINSRKDLVSSIFLKRFSDE